MLCSWVESEPRCTHPFWERLWESIRVPSSFKPEQRLPEATCQNRFHVTDLTPRYCVLCWMSQWREKAKWGHHLGARKLRAGGTGRSASQTLSRLGEYGNSSLGVVKKDGYCSWKSVNVKISWLGVNDITTGTSASCYYFFFNFLFYFGVQPVSNDVLLSGGHPRDTAIPDMYPFSPRLPSHNTQQWAEFPVRYSRSSRLSF